MREYRFQRRLLIAAGALLLAGLACSAPGGAAPTAEPPAATLPPLVATAAPTELPTEASTTVDTNTPPAIGDGRINYPTVEGPVVSSTDCNPPAASGPGAELLVSIYCNRQYRFGFRYAPVGDAAYSGEGPIPMPFEPAGDLAGKYLDIYAQQDQMGCFSAWAEGIVPDEKNSQNLTINNIAFIKMEGVKKSPTTGLYEHWTAYSTFGANVCLIMTFVLETGSETPAFDRAAESAIYETIAGTITWY